MIGNQQNRFLQTLTVTISSGQNLSDASADFGPRSLVGLILPAAWDTAGITFQFSHEASGADFRNAYDLVGEIAFSSSYAVADAHLILDPAQFASARRVKVRSGTAGSPVNQSADRTLTLVLRELA